MSEELEPTAEAPAAIIGGEAGLDGKDAVASMQRGQAIVDGEGVVSGEPSASDSNPMFLPKATFQGPITSLDDFFHSKISQRTAHGLLVGDSGVLAGKAGTFLCWEGPKKGQITLSYIAKDADIIDALITRDNDGDILLNGEETGHDDLVVCINGLQTLFGVKQMDLKEWTGPLLTKPVALVTDKKQLKASDKAFKKHQASMKQARKNSRKMERRLSRKSSQESTSSLNEKQIKEEPGEPGEVIFEHAPNMDLEPNVRRASLRAVSKSSDDEIADVPDPAQEWVKGSLAGVLRAPNLLPPPATDLPEIAGHNVFQTVDAGQSLPIHKWDRKEATDELAKRGNRDGDFVVRWSDKVKNGYVITSIHEGRITNSTLHYEHGQVVYGGQKLGSSIESAVSALSSQFQITPSTGQPYHLVLYFIYDEEQVLSDEVAGLNAYEYEPDEAKDNRKKKAKSKKKNYNTENSPSPPKTHVMAVDNDHVDMRRFKNVPKSTPAHVDPTVRNYGPHEYGMDGVVMQTHVTSAKIATVNEQARGAPDLIGRPTQVDHTSAEIQRVKVAQDAVKRRTSQSLAMSRDKAADASWSGKKLAPGERHEVAEAQGTLNFDGVKPDAVVPGVAGHKENMSPFYFEDMTSKEDAEALLQIVGENGAFLLRPDASMGNTKYTLSVRLNNKVTHHLIYRTRPGDTFTLCCMPYAPFNEEMRHGRDNCITLLAVVKQLMAPRPYWPIPLTRGVPVPSKASYSDMLSQINEYKLQREARRGENSAKSMQVSKSAAPQQMKILYSKAGRRTRSDENPSTAVSKPSPKSVSKPTTKKKVKVVKKVKVAKKQAKSTPGPTFNHGNIAPSEAEALLLENDGSQDTGKFLIRSKNSGIVVISVIFKGKVTHHTAEDKGSGYVVNGKLETQESSVDGLIQFLREKRKGWPLELTNGVPAGIPSGQSKQRILKTPVYYHGTITKSEGDALLLADDGAANSGKFLFRAKDASQAETQLILSVIYKGKVTHHTVSRESVSDSFTVNKLRTECTNIGALVDFLRTKRKGWPVELTDGVINQELSVYENVGGDDDGGEEEEEEIEVEEEVEVEEDVNADDTALSAAAGEDVADGELVSSGPKVTYKVIILTGRRATKAAAALVLHGSISKSDVIPLSGTKMHDVVFVAETEKEFTFDLPDLGPVERITLLHDNKSTEPGRPTEWDVKSVRVDRIDPDAVGQMRHQKTLFECNACIGEADGIQQEFSAKDDKELEAMRAAWQASLSADEARLAYNSRLARAAHLTTANVRVQGNLTHDFDETALEMQTRMSASDLAHNTRRNLGVTRGATETHSIDHASIHISHQIYAPKLALSNPNERVPGAMSRDKVPDSRHDDADIHHDIEIEKARDFEDRGNFWKRPSEGN